MEVGVNDDFFGGRGDGFDDFRIFRVCIRFDFSRVHFMVFDG